MGYLLHNAQKPAIITSFYDDKLASEHSLASKCPLFCHYALELGRWPSRDPIEEQGGINLYGTLGNDIITQWDYLGLRVWHWPLNGAVENNSNESVWGSEDIDGVWVDGEF